MPKKRRSDVNEYVDRWILEQLEHRLAPILQVVKNNIGDVGKELKRNINKLETEITDIILEERERRRDGD